MTDRKPHAGTPTAPGKPAPRRPQQRSQPQPGSPAGSPAGSQQRSSEAHRPQQRNGQPQPRGGEGQRRPSAPAGGPSNGTARPAPRQPSRDDTPTDQIPAVGREAGRRPDAPTPRPKPAQSATPSAREQSASARSSPPAPPADPAPPRRERAAVSTAGTIARDTPSPDRTQAIPVIREPLRERDAESSSTTTAPAAPDETTTPEETKPKRRRWGRGRSTPDADDAGTDTAADDRGTAAVESAKPETPTESSEADDPAPAVRKARLRLVRLDPWSVMKTAFALSIALAIVLVVAVTIVWAVLDVAGVWDAINSSVATILSDNADAFDVTDYVGFGRIIGFTILIAGVDVILITAISTVGAFLYNLSASLLGGVEVTLAENS